MNKQVQDLWDQAEAEVYAEIKQAAAKFKHDIQQQIKSRFAELIVRECANELKRWKSEPFPFDEDLAAKLITDYFGVKQ
jgi:uncharacterized protein (DUF924 family)